jgi:lipoprotein-anchoring transpeptidase ErfK/SrfK
VERVAAEVDRPPQDARLTLSPSGPVTSPAIEGRRVKVSPGVDAALAALEGGQTEVALPVEALPPALTEAEPARTRAEALLARPFTLKVDDLLTEYAHDFAAPPERVVEWLRVVPHAAAQPPRVELELEADAVATWLAEVAPQLGEGRILDVSESLTRTLAALEAGEHAAYARVRHPEGRHVVQPGDYFFDIAYQYGFPQWRLEEANPHVDPENLLIGQELVVPSVDVLVSEPIVHGKRIEIDLPTQTLRAYEGDEQIFEFKVSSGMSKTPTLAGQFQVLMKEPDAYAQRWQLDMPYFMGIYEYEAGFYNGMHELPINAAGTRLWSSILGWPASYGCIILDVGDAQALYDWAPVGTLVRIEGVAPGTPFGEEETLEGLVEE